MDFELLARFSSEPLCIALPNGNFCWLNEAWTELLGWELEVLESLSLLDRVHAEDVGFTQAELSRLSSNNTTICFVSRFEHADRSYRRLQWNMRLSSGYLYCSVRDVTEAHETKRALDRQNQWLESAEVLAQVGHWHVDLVSNAVHWSSQVHRIHGTDSRVFFPDVQTAIEFYHPEDRQFVSNSVEAAVQNQLPFDFRLRLIRADGAERQVHSIGYPEVVSGEVVGIFGVFQDVTERDRWLRERNRELERFAYAAAHDLQAPLRTALGLVQLLKEDGGTNWSPEAEDVLGRLSVHAVRMNHLVAAMHRYASVSEEVRSESIDLERVVTEVWSEFQGELDGQRIEFDRLPCVRGDRRLLKEAFRTLISNSLKFQSELLLQVRVSAQKDGPFWQISVADNGIGFPQTEATRALSLFKQLHRPGTYPGLGMGLPLCKRIIEQHGGTLEITSALGAGTTVRFRLASATEQSLNPSVPPSRMV